MITKIQVGFRNDGEDVAGKSAAVGCTSKQALRIIGDRADSWRDLCIAIDRDGLALIAEADLAEHFEAEVAAIDIGSEPDHTTMELIPRAEGIFAWRWSCSEQKHPADRPESIPSC